MRIIQLATTKQANNYIDQDTSLANPMIYVSDGTYIFIRVNP